MGCLLCSRGISKIFSGSLPMFCFAWLRQIVVLAL
jgi:hypothetical protein